MEEHAIDQSLKLMKEDILHKLFVFSASVFHSKAIFCISILWFHFSTSISSLIKTSTSTLLCIIIILYSNPLVITHALEIN